MAPFPALCVAFRAHLQQAAKLALGVEPTQEAKTAHIHLIMNVQQASKLARRVPRMCPS